MFHPFGKEDSFIIIRIHVLVRLVFLCIVTVPETRRSFIVPFSNNRIVYATQLFKIFERRSSSLSVFSFFLLGFLCRFLALFLQELDELGNRQILHARIPRSGYPFHEVRHHLLPAYFNAFFFSIRKSLFTQVHRVTHSSQQLFISLIDFGLRVLLCLGSQRIYMVGVRMTSGLCVSFHLLF